MRGRFRAAQFAVHFVDQRMADETYRDVLALVEIHLERKQDRHHVDQPADTLDAELAVTNAETALVRALRDYAVANAALERAIGKSWREDVKEYTEPEPMKPNYRP